MQCEWAPSIEQGIYKSLKLIPAKIHYFQKPLKFVPVNISNSKVHTYIHNCYELICPTFFVQVFLFVSCMYLDGGMGGGGWLLTSFFSIIYILGLVCYKHTIHVHAFHTITRFEAATTRFCNFHKSLVWVTNTNAAACYQSYQCLDSIHRS